MSRKAYSEINLHIVWHVKDDIPVLRDEIEVQVHRTLRGQAVNEPGVFLHEIGGTDDHVHLVATIPPTLLISEWIGQLKGSSSHYINHHIANRKVLEWQSKVRCCEFRDKRPALGGRLRSKPAGAPYAGQDASAVGAGRD
jgi:REP element-mobilizing transposase RayT